MAIVLRFFNACFGLSSSFGAGFDEWRMTKSKPEIDEEDWG